MSAEELWNQKGHTERVDMLYAANLAQYASRFRDWAGLTWEELGELERNSSYPVQTKLKAQFDSGNK
jgi:hypothetical protein